MSNPAVPPFPQYGNSSRAADADIVAVDRIGAVPSILRVVCQSTGMGFAAFARVTDEGWTACAVQDNIDFGLKAGDSLDLKTTLCHDSRIAQRPVVFDTASEHPVYRDHPTPKLYGLQTYISVPIVRRDGTYFGDLCAIDPEPRRVSDERTVGMFQLFAELISAQLDSEDRVEASQAALRDAKAVADLREQFIAVLGHDLRDPLSAVAAAAELLVRRSEEPEGAKIGRRLSQTVRRMALLIDDVMDFARGRLGSGVGVHLADVANLGDALRSVIADLEGSHPGRVVSSVIEIDGPVRCDSKRVQQLLSNLLANALTHGAVDRPVEVEASVRAGQLTLVVRNEGEPIPPESLARLFEPYWRAPHSSAGGGLGLGLYICSQIVHAHGGRMSVTSTRATGTRFTVHLPLAARAA